jgi:hypothetical protein
MRVCACLIAAIALVCLAAPMRAQSQGPVTAADLARLDATADAIADQALRIEKSDPALSASVMKSLAPLREDVTYLKVKLRREGSVTRDEFTDVRDRLEMLRLKAMNDPSGKVRAAPVAGDAEPKAWTVPVSTEMEVRLQTLLNSGTAKAEDRFEATTVADVTMGNNVVVIPAGSVVRGFVSSVRASGKIDRTGSLTLSFDEIVIGGVHQRLRAAVVQVLDAKQGEDLTRIGGGAAVGGVIGGLLGGARGALVGVRVGGDGTIAATDGGNVDLPMSTVLRIRLDQPLLVNR